MKTKQAKAASPAQNLGPKYRFVPAGYAYTNFSGLGIYVRYKRHLKDEIRVREHTASHTTLECPDRDLVLVKHGHQDPCYRPTDENYDRYIPLSLFEPEVAEQFNLEFLMTNFVYTEMSNAPKNRSAGPDPVHGAVKVLTDSGGFQLSMQKVDFVDPRKLVEHYNQNTDIGMVLDLPPWGIEDQSLLDRLARTQAINTQVMMEHKRPTLELMNIVQGLGSPAGDRFRKIVERPDITRVSLGGTQDGTLFNAINSTAEFMLTGQQYQHYHALGVYNIPHLLPLMRLAYMKGRTALVTSDASTPVMSSNYKMYHHQQAQYSPIRRVRIGDVATTPSVYHTFPCPCPVCAVIKYVDVLSVLDGATFRHLLMLHNVWEINRYARMMDEAARDLDTKNFKELMREQLGNHRDKRNPAMIAVDFIHAIEQDGLKSAQKHFASHLVKGLFHEKVREEWAFGEPPVLDDEHLHEHVKFLEKVVAVYERKGTQEAKRGKGGKDRKFTASRQAQAGSKIGKKASKKTKTKKPKEKANATGQSS